MKSFMTRSRLYIGLCGLMAMVAITACTPDDEDLTLGNKPEASFTVTPVPSMTNTFLASSTTPEAFMFQWDTGNGFKKGDQTDTLYFERAGTYTVKLRAFGSYGDVTTEQTITVDEDDPDACKGIRQMLTACSSKTWVLMPDAGALVIADPNGNVWWSNGAADVNAADRTCLFNDEYTFSADGTFEFDDLGDFRVDDEGGAAWPTDIGLDIGCYDMSEIPEQYQAWGSGTFSFELSADELIVSGTGAHLGLYKVGQNGTTAVPEESITYNLLELSADELVVNKSYDWGQWTFTLVPKE